MSWATELIDLYDKNQELAGTITYKMIETKKEITKIPYVLLPIAHSTVAAQITVTIDEQGEFIKAEIVPDEDRLTIIPVSEASACRTRAIEPHPLCDNLKYLAGDYMMYYQKEKENENFQINHALYMEGIHRWIQSSICHPKVIAIYQYLKKGKLISDLISKNIITLMENGKMDPKVKIQSVSQTDAFLRFNIQGIKELTQVSLQDTSGSVRTECWVDKTLQACYIAYNETQLKERDLSYLSGEVEAIASLHPKKIRNEGDGAKLFSSNDTDNFTYRGIFLDRNQSFCIGYEDSQKIHNALKWIIRKQGYHWDSLSIVIWESDLKKIPDIRGDTFDIIMDEYGEEEIIDDEENNYQGTDVYGANQFRMAMKGFQENLSSKSRTILMALDAATPGRLALIEYKDLVSSEYLKNIEFWHKSCEWRHSKYFNGERVSYEGMCSIEKLAEVLYGTEKNGSLDLGDKNRKSKICAELYKRLLSCLIERRAIPDDLVRLAVQKASKPQSYKKKYNWNEVLEVACSLYKKQRYDKRKEELRVALDKNSTERNYLYGRLLAVAHQMEYNTYKKEEVRETNAQRYMGAFSQRPFRTWKIIEERLQPYWNRIPQGSRIFYRKLLDEIYDGFTIDEYKNDAVLTGLYLLGYHSQIIELTKKKEENQDE